MRRFTIAFAGLLAAFVVPSPATAEDPFFPHLFNTPTFLVCEGTTQLAQANVAIDGTEAITWDESAPTRSVLQPAGCASAEPGATGDRAPEPLVDLPMAGTFTGNLDAMTVSLYSADTTPRIGPSQQLLVDVVIDGVTRVTDEPVLVSRVGTATTMGHYEFSIRGVGLLSELDSTTSHTVEVVVSTRYIDTGTLNGWVWDTTEFPTGITFNPFRLAPASIRL